MLALIAFSYILFIETVFLIIASIRFYHLIDTARKKIQDKTETIDIPELLPAVRLNMISVFIGTVICIIGNIIMWKGGTAMLSMISFLVSTVTLKGMHILQRKGILILYEVEEQYMV